MGKGKHIIAFIIMFSIIVGTVYITPDVIAKAWTDCTTTKKYSSHDFSSGCPGQTVTCSHTGTKGSCTVTGTGTGSHSYSQKHDETYHWNECSKCGGITGKTKHSYTRSDWTSNGNGTHTSQRRSCSCGDSDKVEVTESCNTSGAGGACSKCGYKATTCSHSFNSEGVCTKCGYTCPHSNFTTDATTREKKCSVCGNCWT